METLNFEAFPLGDASIQQDMPTSRSVYAVCYRHCSHCTGTTTPCSRPVTAVNQACVYMKHIRTYRAQNTNVHKSLRTKVSSALQQCNECVSKLTKDTHTSSSVRHEHNTNLHTYFNRLAYQKLTVTHTNIYSCTEDTWDNNRPSGYHHNKTNQILLHKYRSRMQINRQPKVKL